MTSEKRDSLLCKHISTHLSHQVYSMLYLRFRSTFLIYKFIFNTNKRRLLFATSSFDFYVIYSGMLFIFELCQCKQGSCLVYILEISECYILVYSSTSEIHISCAH